MIREPRKTAEPPGSAVLAFKRCVTVVSMKSLYVGCAIRNAPEGYVSTVESLKKKFEDDFFVLHFVGVSPTATAKEIYEIDIDCAGRADLMLALCDFPSLGLGIELAKRAELSKPTIIAYRTQTNISRMVLGLAEVHSNFQVVEYSDTEELLAIMRENR